MFSVSILRCAVPPLGPHHHIWKTGFTVTTQGRAQSNARARMPCTLVCDKPFPGKAGATTRERQLKRWTHAKKQALITGSSIRRHQLARSRL